MADFKALKAQRLAKVGPARATPAVSPSDDNSEVEAGSAGEPSQPSSAPPRPLNETAFEHDVGSNLRVKELPGRGRGLVAAAHFKSGQPLISTTPLVAVLDASNLSSRCSTCYKSPTDIAHRPALFQCSLCKTIQYCSPACQRADWAAHKPECKALIAYANARPNLRGKRTVPDSPPRALGRLVWAAVARGNTLWAEVSSMQSHLTSLGPAEKESLFQLAVSVAHYVGQDTLNSVVANSTELLDMCSRFVSNSFALTAPDLSNIGVCTSPLLALVNHSCQPNAVVVFPDFAKPNPTAPSPSSGPMRLVAIAPIAPGEEVLTGYVDLTLPEAVRGKELAERYRFECDCGLCLRARKRGTGDGAEEGWIDPREAVACGKRGCGGKGWLPELKLKTGDVLVEYTKCGSSTTINAEAAEAAIAGGVKALAELEKGAPSSATIAPLQSQILTLSSPPISLAPTSHPLLPLRQTLLTHLIAVQDFGPATSALAADVFRSLQEVLPPNHPARGVAAAVVVRLRGAGPDGERNWSTAEGLRQTGVSARSALEELLGMGSSGGAVRSEVEGVLRGVEEGLGRLGSRAD